MPAKGTKMSEEAKKLLSKSKKKHNKYIEKNNYFIGETKRGYKFIIDKEDYNLVNQYCWHKHQDGYLRTCCNHIIDKNGRIHNKYILMHRLIMNMGKYDCNDKFEIDHINGKPYDNRKENLRIVTHMQNMKNIKLSVSNTSGYKGMHWCKLEKKWKAFIAVNKRTIHLGTFANKEDAINARKEAEKKYYNKFSRNSEDLLNGTR